MHVVMLSDKETAGGASVSASRLAAGLHNKGHQVTRIVAAASGQEQPWKIRILATPASPYWRGFRFLLPSEWKTALSHSFCKTTLDRMLAELHPDVISIRNLHGAAWMGWQPDMVETCLQHAPTVWTLHDMWSFTGRCAYSYDCRKFVDGCDASCPTPNEYPALKPQQISTAWNDRKRMLSTRQDLVAVAPSRWLAREAKAGLWSGHRIEVIPYGLSINDYRPVDRNVAKQALGLESTMPVLLTAAADFTSRRKGAWFLQEALREWSGPPVTLLTMGTGTIAVENRDVEVHSLGYVDPEHTKVLAYCAASFLVHPAPVDNFPNVVMEAIACGTPVVAFDTGGLPEMVRSEQTGWLSQEVSPDGLARTIQTALNDLQSVDLRGSCRMTAEREYSNRLETERYLKLFQGLLDRRIIP